MSRTYHNSPNKSHFLWKFCFSKDKKDEQLNVRLLKLYFFFQLAPDEFMYFYPRKKESMKAANPSLMVTPLIQLTLDGFTFTLEKR